MSADSFWHFSLRVYERPGVSEACLALQDRFGLDVNLLLFCCWTATRGSLSRQSLEESVRLSEQWAQAVVRPLRAVRTRLKDETLGPGQRAAKLRERVKADELEAERVQQEMLEGSLLSGTALSPPSGKTAARAHLRLYLGILDVAATPELERQLKTVLAACRSEWN